MESLFFLIPLAVLFAGLSIWAFFWAVNQRQFDDLENAGRAALFDTETRDGAPSSRVRRENDRA